MGFRSSFNSLVGFFKPPTFLERTTNIIVDNPLASTVAAGALGIHAYHNTHPSHPETGTIPAMPCAAIPQETVVYVDAPPQGYQYTASVPGAGVTCYPTHQVTSAQQVGQANAVNSTLCMS